MAKTKAQLITDWRQHIGQTDSTNSNFTDALGLIWMNDAYRELISRFRHLPITSRDYSVTGQTLTLNSNLVTVDSARLKNPDQTNSDGSYKYESLRIVGLEDLIALDPDYENATTSVPTHLVRTGTFSAVFYPPPKASVIALTTPLRLQGLELPTELSADSDTPDLPGNTHTLIPHWMAYRSFSALENQLKATEHLTLWNSGIKSHKGLATEFSKQKKHWSFGVGIQ